MKNVIGMTNSQVTVQLASDCSNETNYLFSQVMLTKCVRVYLRWDHSSSKH